MDVQEGRNEFDEILTREVEDARENLLDALARAEAGIAETRSRLADGHLIPTSVTGGAHIVPENVNALGTNYVETTRRRARLLAAYDRVNGTVAEV